MNIEDLYGKMVDMLLYTKAITVEDDFHTQCGYVTDVTSNDVTGVVNTILDYAIDSASSANYRIECGNQTVEDLLNKWLGGLNDDLVGTIPTGATPLSKEYFTELFKGSSFCVLRAKDWKDITIGNNKILVPKALYFANGSSIYVDRKDTKNVILGSDKYYLDNNKKNSLPGAGGNEEIIVHKNGARWQDAYPIPYIVRKGIYKNHKALQILMDKGDEAVTKVLPYLFLLSMGSEALVQKGITTKPADLEKTQKDFKKYLETYKNSKGKLPSLIDDFDKKYAHLIPDLRPILSQDLFTQGYRAILAGLGFIDLLEIAISRQEIRLNPKPFIASVNAGVDGFKSILTDLAKIIIKKNIADHRKLFSENNSLTVVSSPLKINIEQIMDALRSGFVYGASSITSYQEILGLDPETEKLRRQKERDEGLEELFYPHIITNQEDKGIDTFSPSKPKITKKQEEKQVEKTKKPTTMNKAELGEIAKCKKCGHEFDYLSVQEAGMGWVKCPKCEEAVSQDDLIIAPYDKSNPPAFLKKYPKEARDAFIDTFNKLIKNGKPESYAFPVAWNVLKRVMKKLKEKK